MSNAIVLFILAGLAEIGGGYLVWLWLREAKPAWCGLVGGFILDWSINLLSRSFRNTLGTKTRIVFQTAN